MTEPEGEFPGVARHPGTAEGERRHRPERDHGHPTSGLGVFLSAFCTAGSAWPARSRLAQPEAELTKHTRALANPDGNAIPLPNPGTECFPVPQVPAQTNLPRRVTQNPIHPLLLFFRQASGPPRSFALQQSRQTASFKTTDPILHRSWRIAQKMGHLRAGHTLSYQQHSMETTIVKRDSSERRISSCSPRMMWKRSAMVSGFILL